MNHQVAVYPPTCEAGSGVWSVSNPIQTLQYTFSTIYQSIFIYIDPSIDRDKFIFNKSTKQRHNAIHDAKLAKACFDFIQYRTDLDINGWSEQDIFKH